VPANQAATPDTAPWLVGRNTTILSGYGRT
jgi:hypothetical protein